jgi:hypothetical protein
MLVFGRVSTVEICLLVVGAQERDWHTSCLVETNVLDQVIRICDTPVCCAVASSHATDVAATTLVFSALEAAWRRPRVRIYVQVGVLHQCSLSKCQLTTVVVGREGVIGRA